MRPIFKSFTVAVALLLVSASAFARGFDDRSSTVERKFDENLSAQGVVYCGNENHVKSAHCDLTFYNERTGQTVNLSEADELKETHCSNHRDLRVKLDGTYTMKSIFGDFANVDSFEVLAELPHRYMEERLSSSKSVRTSQHGKFDRGI